MSQFYHTIKQLTISECQSSFMKGDIWMYKNKNGDRNNIVGISIRKLRLLQPDMSQRILAEKMQLVGIDLNKNAIQRIESGERFVTDIELKYFAEIFGVTPSQLYDEVSSP